MIAETKRYALAVCLSSPAEGLLNWQRPSYLNGASRAVLRVQSWRQAGQEGGDCGGDMRGKLLAIMGNVNHPLRHVVAGQSSSLRGVRPNTLRSRTDQRIYSVVLSVCIVS